MALVNTPVGILSFPVLFKPKAFTEGMDPRFSISLLFDKAAVATPEYTALKKAVHQVIVDAVGATKAADAAFIRTLRLPFRPCSEKADKYDGYDRHEVFIAPWTKNKPGLVDGRLQDILDPDAVWAGQLARAAVSPFYYDKGANKGVNLTLSHVQITKRDMPRMDGRAPANKQFGAVEDDSTGSAGGGDDEIPF